MRRSKSGWTARDLDQLYAAFGFEKREGGKHVIYSHPDHADLYATVTRHRSLPKGYVQFAVKLIDSLKAREGARQ